MSRPRSTFAKRQREQSQTERAQSKLSDRAERKKVKDGRPASVDGEDPDIAGITPGPQPREEDED